MVPASGAGPAVKDTHRADVRFRPDCAPEALPELSLHLRDNGLADIMLQRGILFPLRLAQRIGGGKGETRQDERGDHISRKINAFPAGARREQHRVLTLLELTNDILRVTPYLHDRNRQPSSETVGCGASSKSRKGTAPACVRLPQLPDIRSALQSSRLPLRSQNGLPLDLLESRAGSSPDKEKERLPLSPSTCRKCPATGASARSFRLS